MELGPSLEGRCGSCMRFVHDRADSKSVYGHCGRKPRIGSVHHLDYKCDDYRMLPQLRQMLEVQAAVSAAPAAPLRPQAAPHRPPAPVEAVRPPVLDDEEDEDEDDMRERPATPAGLRPAPSTPSASAPASPSVSVDGGLDEDRLRQIVGEAIDELLGLSHVPLANRWRGGELVLKPSDPTMLEKAIPIEVFWHKIVLLREQLRNLERVVNAQEGLADADKVQIQQYITRCYGSLTTFNVLFKDKSQQFRGSGG